nr:MAG: hypothetical protein DIU70_14315 [Bacillota bacterium]
MGDLMTGLWKEWRELRATGGLRSAACYVALFGLFLRWRFGSVWLASPTTMLAWAWFPLFLVGYQIADAVAGERERRTLETLLASRPPAWAVLGGKLLAVLLYVCGIVVGSATLALVVINLTVAAEGLVLFPPPMMLLLVAGTALAGTVVALIGVLVSLRSATVRQAQQRLGVAILAAFIGPMLLGRLYPPLPQMLVRMAGNASPVRVPGRV